MYYPLSEWIVIFWSGRRGSNSPPIAWKAIALPNELLPLVIISIFNHQLLNVESCWWEFLPDCIMQTGNSKTSSILSHSLQRINPKRAVDENWTHDLFLTKEVLYPWATTAWKKSNVLFQKTCSGQSRVRTYVLVREQIYSLSPLTTRPSAHFWSRKLLIKNPKPSTTLTI